MSNGRPEIVSVMHFTAEEARKMLGVCKETMYAYVKSGRIRRYRLSDRKYLYDRADVLYVAANFLKELHRGAERPAGRNQVVHEQHVGPLWRRIGVDLKDALVTELAEGKIESIVQRVVKEDHRG